MWVEVVVIVRDAVVWLWLKVCGGSVHILYLPLQVTLLHINQTLGLLLILNSPYKLASGLA